MEGLGADGGLSFTIEPWVPKTDSSVDMVEQEGDEAFGYGDGHGVTQ